MRVHCFYTRTTFFLACLVGCLVGLEGNTNPSQSLSSALITQQITTLTFVVASRKEYFPTTPTTGTYTQAMQYLTNMQNSITLLARDEAYPEVSWFLDQINNAIGQVGTMVSLGADTSAIVNNIARYVPSPNTSVTQKLFNKRVYSSSFCFIVMVQFYDDLLKVLAIIPPLPNLPSIPTPPSK